MTDTELHLRNDLQDAEYAESYAESFLNAFIATQIKVIREQRELTQAQLAEKIGTTQTGVSRIEDVDYSSWSTKTLKKLAAALEVRLSISFEEYGSLPEEVEQFNRTSLERTARSQDPKIGDFGSTSLLQRDMAILERIAIAQSLVTNIEAYRTASTKATPTEGQSRFQHEDQKNEEDGLLAICK